MGGVGMKLAFPHGERADIPMRKGQYAIGNASSDDIQLGDTTDAPLRGVIVVDQRGITLSLDSASDQPVHVNNRLVREKAILRLGDVLRIADLEMVLQSDSVELADGPEDYDAAQAAGSLPSRYHLRGINGLHSGQVFAVNGRISLSRRPESTVKLPPDEEIEVVIGTARGGVFLQVESGQGELLVNGYSVESARLHAGDQITIGDDRYLLEAPNFVPGDAYTGERQADAGSNTQVFQAISADVEEDTPKPQPAAELDLPPPKKQQMDPATKRDAIIIGVCVVLSVMMLVWLYTNL